MEIQEVDQNQLKPKQPRFANIEIYVIVVIFMFMMIALFVQVASRFVFSDSYAWIEPMARLGFIWITFAGVSLAAGKSMHLRVSLINSIAPKKIGPFFLFVGDLIAVIFGFYMAYHVYNNMIFLMGNNTVYTAVRWLPKWIMYLPGVIGLIGFSLRLIETSIYPSLKVFFRKKRFNDK
ncbi:TRAP transporter small permease [Virgibacillus sp. W0181]|uniref:TRAP transporter small permease n=1 Tax=Virgibacillus sp. W0181 TaxID=3391581 RepID=UPI003F47014F